MKKVVVLGGGFAGVEAAIQLRKRGFAVTLVSDRDYLFIYPISIWVPTGGISWDDACQPLAPLAATHGFELVVSPVKSFDLDGKKVQLADSELAYDTLVLAIGSGKTKPPGVEHTLSPCGAPEGSIAIRDRYQEIVAKAKAHKASGETEPLRIACGFGGNPLDTSAVRGGPMFEVLFNLHHHLKQQGLLEQVKLDFFAPMPDPAKKMADDAPEKLRKWMGELNIGWKAGVKIERFDADGVRFADGTTLPADLTLFIAAGTGHPLMKTSGLPLSEAGFVKIDQHCKVEGRDDVYAAGDVAALEGPPWKAKQGHLAEAMGRIIAHNLAAIEGGRPDAQESYGPHITILCVMDTGNGATFVYRDAKRSFMLPAPIVGHWAKQAWGTYWKKSKAGKMPRIPGM